MKSLSSHIKHITEIQNADYYFTLSEEEQRNFDKSTFFIWERLGLCMELIPIIDKYKTALNGIKGNKLYTALIEIIPKGEYEFKQLKRVKKIVYDSEFVDLVKKEFSCSDKIAKEYIDIYVALGDDLKIYNDLKNKYGQQNSNHN